MNRKYDLQQRLIKFGNLSKVNLIARNVTNQLQLFFTVTKEGLSQEGFAMGNLVVVVIAIVVSASMLLLSHPVPNEK